MLAVRGACRGPSAAWRVGGRAALAGQGRSSSTEAKYAAPTATFESLLLDSRVVEQARNAKMERKWYVFKRQFEKPLLAQYQKMQEEKEAEAKRLAGLRRKVARRIAAALKKPIAEREAATVKAGAEHKKTHTRDWDAVRGLPTDVDFQEILQDGPQSYLEKTRFLPGHGVGELLPIEAFLFQNNQVRHLDGFYFNMEQEDVRDHKLMRRKQLPENEERTDEQILHDIYVEDLKDRLTSEMEYKMREAGLEVLSPEEVAAAQEEFAALPREQRSKKLKPVNADVEFIRYEYIEPRGNPHKDFIERKARMLVHVDRLNLPDVVYQRLRQLAGRRLCPQNGVLTIVSDEHPNKHQNTIHCMHLVRDLLEEAFLAYPHYMPLSDLEQSPVATVASAEEAITTFIKEKKMMLTDEEQERKQEQDAIPAEIAALIAEDSQYKQFATAKAADLEEEQEPFTLYRIGSSYFRE